VESFIYLNIFKDIYTFMDFFMNCSLDSVFSDILVLVQSSLKSLKISAKQNIMISQYQINHRSSFSFILLEIIDCGNK